MKKYPKIVQCDSRGQIVIPKDVRSELKIEEGTGFYVYTVTDEGILLKKIPDKDLDADEKLVTELKDKSEKIGLKKDSVDKTVKAYKRKSQGGLEVI